MLNPFVHRRVLKTGIAGKARVASFRMPRGIANENIPMTLEVYVEGRAPYLVEGQWWLNRKDRIGSGLELPVRVDRDDPDKVAIDWKAARELRAKERAEYERALASRQVVDSGQAMAEPFGAGGLADIASQFFDSAPSGAGEGEGAQVDPEDPLSKLERLAELHRSGALSDEEFAAKKAELLREV